MKIIYVEDEILSAKMFERLISDVENVEFLGHFVNGYQALDFARNNKIDLAFLDIEMPEINGIDLAKKLREIYPSIKLCFLTGYSQYALDAFGVDAIGYLLKPFSKEDVLKQIEKARVMQTEKSSRIFIRTMPRFDMFVDNKLVIFSSQKAKELLALMVDKEGGSVSTDYAITYLWEDKPNDESTKSLFRMVYKKLRETLESVKALDILIDCKNN